jgi:hypothetical protein
LGLIDGGSSTTTSTSIEQRRPAGQGQRQDLSARDSAQRPWARTMKIGIGLPHARSTDPWS